MTTPVSSLIRRRRLHRLAAFLAAFRPTRRKRFDMHVYGLRGKCGTAACALGWAATIPAFRRAGLRLEWTGNAEDGYLGGVAFAGEVGVGAGRKFFGLSYHEAGDLFLGSGPRRHVVAELRRLARISPPEPSCAVVCVLT